MKLGERVSGDWSYGEYALTCKKKYVIPRISSRQTKCTRGMSKKALLNSNLMDCFQFKSTLSCVRAKKNQKDYITKLF